jgi:hypothetical protein
MVFVNGRAERSGVIVLLKVGSARLFVFPTLKQPPGSIHTVEILDVHKI